MGNLGGGEVLVILLVALIVLGPTKLPPAIRQVGRVVGEFRRIGQGFQQELREAAQPLQETKETLKAADKEFREVAQKPIEEMKETLKAADKEFRAATQEPIEEMKDTLKAADKELREVAQEPLEEMKETLKAADKEFRAGTGEPAEEKGATPDSADEEPSEYGEQSSPEGPDSGSENAA